MRQRPPLPLDIVLDIVPFVSRQELLQLSSLSRGVSEAACEWLYKDLVFSNWETILHFKQHKLSEKHASRPRTLHLKSSLSDDWDSNSEVLERNGIVLAGVIHPYINLTSFINDLKESPRLGLYLPSLEHMSVCLWSQLRELYGSKPTNFRLDPLVRANGEFAEDLTIYNQFQFDWEQLIFDSPSDLPRAQWSSVKVFDIDLRFISVSGVFLMDLQKIITRALPLLEKIIIRIDGVVYDRLAHRMPRDGIYIMIGGLISHAKKSLKVVEIVEHIGSKPHSSSLWRNFWKKGGGLEQYCRELHPGLETYKLQEERA